MEAPDLVNEYHVESRRLDLTAEQRRECDARLLGRLLGLCEESPLESRARKAIREEVAGAACLALLSSEI